MLPMKPQETKSLLATLIGVIKEPLLPLKIKVLAAAAGALAQPVSLKDLQNSKRKTYKASPSNNSLIAVEKMDSNVKDALELGLNGL